MQQVLNTNVVVIAIVVSFYRSEIWIAFVHGTKLQYILFNCSWIQEGSITGSAFLSRAIRMWYGVCHSACLPWSWKENSMGRLD